MTDNGGHSFTEGSEPIKLTEERIPKRKKRYNKIIGRILTDEPCPSHKVEKLTMLEWYGDSERRKKEKQKQTQCKKCGRWYYPDEM